MYNITIITIVNVLHAEGDVTKWNGLKIKELFPEKLDNIKISKSSNNCWRFNIEKQKAFNIAKWLYEDATIYLERKFQAYNNAKHIYNNMPRG